MTVLYLATCTMDFSTYVRHSCDTSTCAIRTLFEGLNTGVLQAAIPGQ